MNEICKHDYNNDGDCHIHPNGCPDPAKNVSDSVIRKALDDLLAEKIKQHRRLEEMQNQFDQINAVSLSVIREKCSHTRMVERTSAHSPATYRLCSLCGWRDTP